MRLSLSLITLAVLVGCQPAAEVTTGSSSKNINAEAPYIWSNKNFPKQMRISSHFTPDEMDAMTDMASQWKASVANTEFIAFGSATNNSYDLNDPDSVMGIYKATTWPKGVSEDALAITQLFGRRYNVGAANEYVGIVHADIIMNYAPDKWGDYFDWFIESDDSDVEGYDLRSIVLHEMGHFLGLQHIARYENRSQSEKNMSSGTYKATSVMYPFISDGVSKRIPQTKDINALASKYNIGGAGSHMALSRRVASYEPQNNDTGKSVKIVIELRKSGECLHKEDGAVVKRHHVKIK